MKNFEKEKLIRQLNRSGHNLHLRIVDKLYNSGLKFDKITICEYFKDISSDKYREIDIIAERNISNNKTLRLFIECKYIKEQGNSDDCQLRSMAFYEINFFSNQYRDILYRKYYLDSNNFPPSQFYFLEDSIHRQSYFYGNVQKSSKVAIICEPYKELFSAVDTCLKAKLFKDGSQPGQKFIDYLIIVIDSSCKIFRIDSDNNLSGEFQETDLKEINGYELLLVNYPDTNMVNRQYFIEIIKEDLFVDIIKQIFDESNKVLYDYSEIMSFSK